MTTTLTIPKELTGGVLLEGRHLEAILAHQPFLLGKAEVSPCHYPGSDIVHLRYSAEFADRYVLHRQWGRSCDKPRCAADPCSHPRWLTRPACGSRKAALAPTVAEAPPADLHRRSDLNPLAALEKLCGDCIRAAHELGHAGLCIHDLLVAHCRRCKNTQRGTALHDLAEDHAATLAATVAVQTGDPDGAVMTDDDHQHATATMRDLLALGVAPWFVTARTGLTADEIDHLIGRAGAN